VIIPTSVETSILLEYDLHVRARVAIRGWMDDRLACLWSYPLVGKQFDGDVDPSRARIVDCRVWVSGVISSDVLQSIEHLR